MPEAFMRKLRVRGASILLWLVGSLVGWGLDPVGPPGGHEAPLGTESQAGGLRKLADGIFQIGEVRIVQSNRSAVFPGRVNQTNGLVEYFLVTAYGPTHESVLQTDAEPLQVHLAMLALGAKGGTNAMLQPGSRPGTPPTEDGAAARESTPAVAAGSSGGGGPITEPMHELIPGDPVLIEISWPGESGTVRRRAEELIWNAQTSAAMTIGPWHYNGSMKPAGVLLAQGNGILASVIADPSALINNPRPGRDNDDIWFVRSNALPAIGTSVEIRVSLAGPKPNRP